MTGGLGYIGSHTAVALLRAGHDVVIVDNLANSDRTVLARVKALAGKRVAFEELDLRDEGKLGAVFGAHKAIDAVVHMAGLKAVAESVRDPLLYYDVNINSTLALLRCMRRHGCHRLLFSSSATVYGDQDSPLHEDAVTGYDIASPYGRTKHFIEEMIRDQAAADPRFSAVLLRYFNPIGAHPSGLLGESPRGVPNNLFPLLLQVVDGSVAQLNAQLKVYGTDYDTPDGTCVRDYVHVMDVAEGHVAAVDASANRKLGQGGVAVYNLGTGRGTSVRELVSAMEKATDRDVSCIDCPRRAGDVAVTYACADKAALELGWSPKRSILDACRDGWRYVQKRAELGLQ